MSLLSSDHIGETPDFLLWSHDTLARFAKEVWEQNVTLRQDLKALHESWRELVKNQELGKLPTK